MGGCGPGSRAPCPGAQCHAARPRPGGGGPQSGRPVGGGAPQLGAACQPGPPSSMSLSFCCSVGLCLTFSLSLWSLCPSLHPSPPAPCLLSHFPLSGSLFLHLTLFPPVSLYLPVSPHSFLFLFSSTPQALAFWVSASKCPLSRASALKGDFFILASAVPAHQGTLERAFPLLGLHFPTCKMERQLGGASRGLWALMRE